MFQEGGSQFGIHAMRTAGIDRHREKRFLLIAKESTRLITTRMNG